MNIYLHLEVSVRELDSKLLLAVLSASRGHEVIISDIEFIEKGLIRGYLNSGIFHTKSLSPGKIKIKRHQSIIESGSKITSIDEEAGLDIKGYEKFSKTRYSEKTIEQASAVFGWGDSDTQILKKKYNNFSHKIYKTGSPRVDLLKSAFKEYWQKPKTIPEKPFLLISSNMVVCNRRSFHRRIENERKSNYFDSAQELFDQSFISTGNDYFKALKFIDAIKYLSKKNNGYDIVLRPHPSEDVDCWKNLLKGIPNLHVIHDGPMNAWIKYAFAIMHHGCTSAIETTIFGKPVITYLTPELKEHHLNNNLTNELGYIVRSKEDLLQRVNGLNSKYENISLNDFLKKNLNKISEKIYMDDELAAEKIIKIWEKIYDNKTSISTSSFKINFFNYKTKVNKFIGNILKKISPLKFGNLGSKKENSKIQSFDQQYISKKINQIQKILKIEKQIEFKIISERTIFIKCK